MKKEKTSQPVQTKNLGGRPRVQLGKLDEIGIDTICARITDGDGMVDIAQSYGVSFGTLSAWLAEVPERSAREKEARRLSARKWDEKAEQEIRDAKDPLELAKAKELAHHYRWRMAKISPEFNEKSQVELTGKDGGAIQTENLNINLLNASKEDLQKLREARTVINKLNKDVT